MIAPEKAMPFYRDYHPSRVTLREASTGLHPSTGIHADVISPEDQALFTADTRRPADWAMVTADKSMALLGSGSDGLSDAESAARLSRYGVNALPRVSGRRWYVELIANFIHLFALLLWVGAFLAWIAGLPQLTWAIIAVILINGLFSYWQEYQAERAAEALEALLPRQVTVRRGGRELLVQASDVVPGDILVLTEGTAVPADARIVSADRLRLDLSSLTGESRPVPRYASPAQKADGSTAALPNIVFAGTNVTSGRAEAVVFATGAATEFGRIASLTQAQQERSSPLQLELERVTRLVTVLAVSFGCVFFVVGTAAGGLSTMEAFLFAVGIIVANVPEGLLPTLTLSLAMAVRRMAAKNALIKRLSAVETLGSTTVILTDKTGTLTENEMTACEAWTSAGGYRISPTGYDGDGKFVSVQPCDIIAQQELRKLLLVAGLCCDVQPLALRDERGTSAMNNSGPTHFRQKIGDPTEAAILVAAKNLGLSANTLAAFPRMAELPFDSIRKRMATIHNMESEVTACVKGAPIQVFPRCVSIRVGSEVLNFDDDQRRKAQAAHDSMAARGLRVLAVASRRLDDTPPRDGWRVEAVERDLTLLGLLALEDPPRREVPAAIAACRRAGLRVCMVTGDDGLTAAAIGREIGLHETDPHVITGAELALLDDDQLSQLIETSHLLFARVSPEHKLRLVEAFQRKGDIVAVTGDGVNDAPSLKRADIGVAMGETGTDVAREAADMVLTDDNFSSIVSAIEEGRGVYDNVRKFVTYIFSSNIPEILPFIAFVLFRIPLPLTVMQVLAVDLGTDLVPALALGGEAPEPDVMQRKPRSRNQRLLNLSTLLRAYGWLGMIEAVLSFVAFLFAYWLAGWRPGSSMAESGSVYVIATTMSLAGIVACQVGNIFACRSDHRSITQLSHAGNWRILGGIAVELALILTLIYTPPLAEAFGLGPLSWQHWALLAIFAPLFLALEEGRKALIARSLKTNNDSRQ